jgi:SAM-dependent methyltransferase
VRRARAYEVPGIAFVEHDVTNVPLPVALADLVFVRYLLTHLSDPAGALRGWAPALRAGGRIIVQETAALRSGEPALARYYDLVGDLQRHHGQDLTIGARLRELAVAAGLRVVHHALRTYRPSARAMARLHALNLRTWRDDPYACAAFDAAELDDLDERPTRLAEAAPPDITVEHSLGELVIEAKTGVEVITPVTPGVHRMVVR